MVRRIGLVGKARLTQLVELPLGPPRIRPALATLPPEGRGGDIPHNLVFSDEVRAALGGPVVERLLHDRVLTEVVCAVCKRKIGLSTGEAAAVSLEEPLHRVVFTHPSCMPSRLLTTATDAPTQLSAQAIAFAVTDDDGSMNPYLAYETTTIFWELPEGSPDTTDSTIALYLQRGYELVRGPVGSQVLPRLRSWAMKADLDRITIWDDALIVAYTAPTGDVDQKWIDLVDSVGYCNVLTGTGLGVVEGTFTDNVDDAIADGRVVGARIGLAESQRSHP